MTATLYAQFQAPHAVRTGEYCWSTRASPFRRVNFPPGPHRVLVRLFGFKGDRVPAVMFEDGRRARAHELPGARRLIPATARAGERALEAEGWADEVLPSGPAGWSPRPAGRAGRPGRPRGRWTARRAADVRPHSLRLARAVLVVFGDEEAARGRPRADRRDPRPRRRLDRRGHPERRGAPAPGLRRRVQPRARGVNVELRPELQRGSWRLLDRVFSSARARGPEVSLRPSSVSASTRRRKRPRLWICLRRTSRVSVRGAGAPRAVGMLSRRSTRRRPISTSACTRRARFDRAPERAGPCGSSRSPGVRPERIISVRCGRAGSPRHAVTSSRRREARSRCTFAYALVAVHALELVGVLHQVVELVLAGGAVLDVQEAVGADAAVGRHPVRAVAVLDQDVAPIRRRGRPAARAASARPGCGRGPRRSRRGSSTSRPVATSRGPAAVRHARPAHHERDPDRLLVGQHLLGQRAVLAVHEAVVRHEHDQRVLRARRCGAAPPRSARRPRPRPSESRSPGASSPRRPPRTRATGGGGRPPPAACRTCSAR